MVLLRYEDDFFTKKVKLGRNEYELVEIMTRLRIWMIALMVLVAGFLGIGIFKPSATISTQFEVSRSAATSFRVLTLSSNVSSFFNGRTSIESVLNTDKQAGNRYRAVHLGEEGAETLDIELVAFDDLDQFTFQVTSDSRVTRTTYALVRITSGTQVHVTHIVSPSSWFGRSVLPMILGSQIEEQDLINSHLAELIESSPESLIGEWVSVSSEEDEQMFTFYSDGTVNWKVSMGDDVFPLTGIYWNRQSSVQPELLDLSGFTSGPLRGLTLFGIVDMSRRDTLFFDAEAGLPDDDRIRPSTFSSSAVTYVRIR